MITPSLSKIKKATEAAFAPEFVSAKLKQWGVYNRRKIAGSQTWSQHSWGNAWDIGTATLAEGDKVVAWLRAEQAAGRLPIRLILWRVANHFDHVHVEGSPKMLGVPPATDQEEEDMKELVKSDQKALNAGGFKGADGKKLKVDGVLGPNTQHAKDALAVAAAATLSGSLVKGSFSGKVV